MRFLVWTLVLAAGLSAQTANTPADPVRTVVGRLELGRYKAHIKGLAQFGDRMQGTQRNRDAIDWLEKQLRSFGYTNVQRHRFMSGSGPLENIYATKIGTTNPGEMYIVSAHMDGRGGGEAADDDGSGCAVVLELARVLGMPDVQTNRSVRFIFWNNEEFGMDGSGTYALERAPLQGTAAEPKWLGVIQHDMMMFDHGMPPGPKQSPNADIDIEYQRNSRMAADSAKLAAALQAANRIVRAVIPQRSAPTWQARIRYAFRILWPPSACAKTKGSSRLSAVQTRTIINPRTNTRITQRKTFVSVSIPRRRPLVLSGNSPASRLRGPGRKPSERVAKCSVDL